MAGLIVVVSASGVTWFTCGVAHKMIVDGASDHVLVVANDIVVFAYGDVLWSCWGRCCISGLMILICRSVADCVVAVVPVAAEL